jgi:hypothetical protein
MEDEATIVMSRAETLSVLMMAQSHRQLPTGLRCKNMVRPSLGPDLGHATATALTAADTPRHPGGRLCLHQRHRWPECVPPPGLHEIRSILVSKRYQIISSLQRSILVAIWMQITKEEEF